MIDFRRCFITPNDYGFSDLGDPRQFPIVADFWSPGEDCDARRKMLRIVKQIKQCGHQARYKSWAAHLHRYCTIRTDTPAESMRDILSDFFSEVDMDLRPLLDRLRGSTEGLGQVG